MAMLPELAVTGTTGRVGGMIAKLLAAREVPFRQVVRAPDRAPVIPAAPVVGAAYENTEETRWALDGVETLCMVSATESPRRRAAHAGFLDAAEAAGVEHVVYTSFFGASPDATFTFARDHWDTEEHLRASGMSYTFLRDDLYLDLLPEFVDECGVIRGPAGRGRVAAVARSDVAAAAASVLEDPRPHRDATYALTGPHAISLDEAAATISAETSRDVVFVDEPMDEAYAWRARFGAPRWQLDAWVSTYTAIAAGELDGPTEHVRMLTGRQPLSLVEVLRRAVRRRDG